jgi:hypothetical protein
MKKQAKAKKLLLSKQSIANLSMTRMTGGISGSRCDCSIEPDTRILGSACGVTIAFECPTREIDCY